MIMQPGACLLKGAPRRPFYEPLKKIRIKSKFNKSKKRALTVSQSLHPKLVSPFHRMKVVCQKVSNLNQMAIQLLLISTGATTYWASDRVLSHLEGNKYSVFFVFENINTFFWKWLGFGDHKTLFIAPGSTSLSWTRQVDISPKQPVVQKSMQS